MVEEREDNILDTKLNVYLIGKSKQSEKSQF